MNNPFNTAMDLTDSIFAYHLCGVLRAMNESGSLAPDPDDVAREYLDTFHAGWDEEPNEDSYSDAEADADTLASAGWGTDEDYGSL